MEMLSRILKLDLDALINQAKPQRSWEIMMALMKFIAWEGLNPYPLPTSHLRILMYLEDLERKKFISTYLPIGLPIQALNPR